MEAGLVELMRPPNLSPGSANSRDEVVHRLFLGGSVAARQCASGDDGTRAVLNCAERCPGTIDGVQVYDIERLSSAGMRYMGLDMRDGAVCPPIAPLLDVGADFVAECMAADACPVLVHCSAGKSRSPSVVMAYLVKHRGMTLLEAATTVRAARPLAYPLAHFWEQMRAWEVTTRGVNESSLPAEALTLHPDNSGCDAEESAAGKIAAMVSMGFGEAQCLAALQASDGDIQAAVTSLLDGD